MRRHAGCAAARSLAGGKCPGTGSRTGASSSSTASSCGSRRPACPPPTIRTFSSLGACTRSFLARSWRDPGELLPRDPSTRSFLARRPPRDFALERAQGAWSVDGRMARPARPLRRLAAHTSRRRSRRQPNATHNSPSAAVRPKSSGVMWRFRACWRSAAKAQLPAVAPAPRFWGPESMVAGSRLSCSTVSV